jgi:hypothetical protein
MTNKEVKHWRWFFFIAALWNISGGLQGYLNPQSMFLRVFGTELTDPLMISVYKGAWGTALLYFFGYLVVAYNPTRHTGVVILGGLGKFFFIINLIQLSWAGNTSYFALLIITGDFLFLCFFVFFWRVSSSPMTQSFNLKRSVGQGEVCVCGGAGQGSLLHILVPSTLVRPCTARNSQLLQGIARPPCAATYVQFTL